MNLEVAILNVLDTTPRPIPADVIAAYVPQFLGQPAHADPDKAAALVLVACQRMKLTDDVLGIPNRDHGILWKLTANGKARIA